jgi:hypothetical protein
MLHFSRSFIALIALAISAPAVGATPESWAKLDMATEAACLKAANLAGAKAGPPIRYSDKAGIDARVVEGAWPQPHMKGAKARMLCLYNRKNKRPEVQELPESKAPPIMAVKDATARSAGGRGATATLPAICSPATRSGCCRR